MYIQKPCHTHHKIQTATLTGAISPRRDSIGGPELEILGRSVRSSSRQIGLLLRQDLGLVGMLVGNAVSSDWSTGSAVPVALFIQPQFNLIRVVTADAPRGEESYQNAIVD